MPPRLRSVCHVRWQAGETRRALANDDGKTGQTGKANAGIYRKKTPVFAICHLFYRGFEKEKKKAKNERVCARMHLRARGNVRCACFAQNRAADSLTDSHDMPPLPYVAARHGMRAKPCYRIGELLIPHYEWS